VKSTEENPLTHRPVFLNITIYSGLVLMFLIGVFPITLFLKVAFAIIVLAIIALLISSFGLGRKPSERKPPVGNDSELSLDIDSELQSLEEAAVYFSASLKTSELARLLDVRLADMLDGAELRFLVVSDTGELTDAATEDSTTFSRAHEGLVELAGKAIGNKCLVSSESFDREDDRWIGPPALATPLERGGQAFGALTVTARAGGTIPEESTVRLIGEKTSPLLAGSISFESTVANALTDSLTKLPNERALGLILDNQIAEAHRYGKDRPLAVLAVDISSFAEINRRFGHVEGDKLLTFAGRILREELRKMDFLARTSSDEFLIVLPTATPEKASAVIVRIVECLDAYKYELPTGDRVNLELCFGTASYGEDGITSEDLVRHALKRKQIKKATDRGSVLKFPNSH